MSRQNSETRPIAVCDGSFALNTKHHPSGVVFCMVGLEGLEPSASSSRTKRATNCAIARRNRERHLPKRDENSRTWRENQVFMMG
jgi:hypothetical protein